MKCVIVDDDKMIRVDLEKRISQLPFLELVGSYGSPMEASGKILSGETDLLFLDVELPGMSGLQFLETIEGIAPQVILITSKKDYAVDAFNYDVTDFIVKPVSDERFLKAVNKARKKFELADLTLNPGKGHVFIKVNSRLMKLDLKEILYIEALADYVNIHTEKHKYTVHYTMKGIESALPSHEFYRAHNSYIIRIDKINSIEDNCAMINGQPIPVSRNKYKPLLDKLNLL